MSFWIIFLNESLLYTISLCKAKGSREHVQPPLVGHYEVIFKFGCCMHAYVVTMVINNDGVLSFIGLCSGQCQNYQPIRRKYFPLMITLAALLLG